MNQRIKVKDKRIISISVVTVVFNGSKVIEETILSVINQTYKNVEYIIIDGQSTDGTQEIIKKYKGQISHYISEKDNGVYEAMNKALKIASGEFLIFMNAGDKFSASFTLEKFVKSISDLEAVYYGDTLYVDQSNKEVYARGGKFNKLKFYFTNICHQSIFYPKHVYSTMAYNTKYTIYSDWEYNLKLRKKGVIFIFLPMIICTFELGGISSNQKDIEFGKDFSRIIIRNLGWVTYLSGYLKSKFRVRKWLGIKE